MDLSSSVIASIHLLDSEQSMARETETELFFTPTLRSDSSK